MNPLLSDVSRETIKAIGPAVGNQEIGLPESSAAAFYLHHLYLSGEGRLLVVVPSDNQIQAFRDDLESIDANLVVFHYEEFNWERVYSEENEIRLLSERVETLRLLQETKRAIIFLSARSLVQKVPPPKDFFTKQIQIKAGMVHSWEPFLQKLEGLSYQRETIVTRPGDYAVRGGLVDVFSFGQEAPVRIDFFGDVVESIRLFDPRTQLSLQPVSTTTIYPGYSQSRGLKSQVCLFDYLQSDDRIAFVNETDCRSLVGEVKKSGGIDATGTPVQVSSWEELASYFDFFPVFRFRWPVEHPSVKVQSSLSVGEKTFQARVAEYVQSGYRVLVSYDLPSQEERIRTLLAGLGLEQRVTLVKPSFHEGFELPDSKLLLLAEHQVFDRYRRPSARHQIRIRNEFKIQNLSEIRRGDFVVHEDHGIGKFIGLTKIRIGDRENEVIRIEFQNRDVLFLNVKMVDKIARYRSREAGITELNKLGAPEWERKRQQTRNKIKEYARELIGLYAKRKQSKGYSFGPRTAWSAELEASFMYEDTPDQEKAWKEVAADMENESPMDRLICGDVGFGKTEIAVRAAFKAVQDTKQVAVLVPTTILAEQHVQTFRKRMSAFPVRVDVMSRFRTSRELKEIKEQLAAGKIDIIIGTTSLLGSEVAFKDLGLLIIDEEHRFGVKEKERIKSLKTNVDILSLSATPIPRTMQLSMMGARDLSLIATPPVNRRPIRVSVEPFAEDKIKTIVLQELNRGGQVFFIHNRVKSIYAMANFLKRLLPRIRIQVAHGKMTGRELEDIMHAFVSREIDVLLSTNIVESGVDIPNANTIIINRADRFGLAELYQLKGRVGRSTTQGYCYLLIPPMTLLKKDSIRRLLTIEEFSDLGSGFNVAMRDLDLRGSGNILGMEQSGFTETMGLELYHQLLEDAVEELKDEEFSDLFARQPKRLIVREVVVESWVSGQLPETYIDEPALRFDVYKRLSRSTQPEQISELEAEMNDRFGQPPIEAKVLVWETRIRLAGQKIGAVKIALQHDQMQLQFPPADHRFFKNGYFEQLLNKLTVVTYPHTFTDQKGILTLGIRVPEWKGLAPEKWFGKAYDLLSGLQVV
ncbi:MAG: transcription-repair coupling factor [Bacteroidetes bacterium]|nr:transcription-repair coupling factor [Bacteroidota bacterium]